MNKALKKTHNIYGLAITKKKIGAKLLKEILVSMKMLRKMGSLTKVGIFKKKRLFAKLIRMKIISKVCFL